VNQHYFGSFNTFQPIKGYLMVWCYCTLRYGKI